MCAQYKVPLLGELPLAPEIREDADSGTPTVIKNPDGEVPPAIVKSPATPPPELHKNRAIIPLPFRRSSQNNPPSGNGNQAQSIMESSKYLRP